MHRCLLVPEILEIVLDSKSTPNQDDMQELDQQRTRSWDDSHEMERVLTPRDLLAIALACKLFLEPALDILWGHVPDIYRLLRCFPRDLWEEIPDPTGWFGGKTFSLIRPLQGYDWERFDFYAHRVKSLRIDASRDDEPESERSIEIGVFQAMSFSCDMLKRPKLLLKNARHLRWNRIQNFDHLFFITFFIGPHLTTLDLEWTHQFEDYIVPVACAFDAIVANCPNINSLSITSYHIPQLRDRLAAFVCEMHNLRILNLYCDLDHRTLSHLGYLPCLQKINLRILDYDDNLTGFLSSVTDYPWESLSEVHLEVPHLPYATKLMNTFVSRPLKVVEICVDNSPTSSELQQFFNAVVQQCIPSQVIELDVSHYLPTRSQT